MLDIEQIIMLYSSINRGMQNYYRFADNWRRMSQIQYILHFSLVKTLAVKLNMTCKKVFKRFGKEISVMIEAKDDQSGPRSPFLLQSGLDQRPRSLISRGKGRDIDMLHTSISMRTRSKLGKPCCICGLREDEGQIVMHHVRHIRKLSRKREPTGFNHILRKLNRKQIPVCEECHHKIHQGAYDGLKLSSLAYLPL